MLIFQVFDLYTNEVVEIDTCRSFIHNYKLPLHCSMLQVFTAKGT